MLESESEPKDIEGV